MKTEVKQVDTRTFELEITGPGFAWSTVAGPAAESSFMQFRDTVNARGSSTDDVGAFTAAQTAHVAALGQSSEQAALTAQSAASTATDLAAEYDGAWSAYANARLPLVQELACRWATSPIPSRAGIIVAGPTILLALVAWLGIAMSNGEASMPLRAIGVYLVLLVGACLAYLYKVRLVK